MYRMQAAHARITMRDLGSYTLELNAYKRSTWKMENFFGLIFEEVGKLFSQNGVILAIIIKINSPAFDNFWIKHF